MRRILISGLASLFVVALFMRQIIPQLGTGKVRPGGSKADNTREENPASYWSAIGEEIATILIAVHLLA